MRKIKKYITLFILAFMTLITAPRANSCSLAVHEWHLVWYKKIFTETPVFPLCESDILIKGEFEPSKNVFWVTPKANSCLTFLNAVFLPVLNGIFSKLDFHKYMASGLPDTSSPNKDKNFPWCKKLTWLPLESGKKLAEIVKKHKEKDYIVIGSDKNTLKIAIFADALSKYNCYQIVLLQDGRLRAIQPSDTKPTATEVRALAYASIIWYGNPFNLDIISASLSPIAGTRCFFIQREEFATKLINEGKLEKRASSESDPASYNIPDIPDE